MLQVEIYPAFSFLGICHSLNLVTTIVWRSAFAAEYVFSMRQASSFETSYWIMTGSKGIQEHEESPISGAGNKPLSIYNPKPQKKSCLLQ